MIVIRTVGTPTMYTEEKYYPRRKNRIPLIMRVFFIRQFQLRGYAYSRFDYLLLPRTARRSV